MNYSILDSARQLWIKEEPLYDEYGSKLIDELANLFKDESVPVSLSYRVKKDESLLKKMLVKKKEYSELNDKVGARAIVHFLSDLNNSDEFINKYFSNRIVKRESKKEISDDKTFGYLSIHYDIIDDVNSDNPLICELQLRTVCQNTWSELAHILSYKSNIEIPYMVKREINALSALMEIADNQFQRISDIIRDLPESEPSRILRLIDGFFYSHIAAWYDVDMSFYFLDNISEIYDSKEDIPKLIQNYIEENGSEISTIANKRKDILYFSQPEIVVILERLEVKQFLLEKYWVSKYPIDHLHDLAIAWGTPIN